MLWTAILLGILQYTGCATLPPPSPEERLSLHEARAITSEIRDQADRVSSFYTSGTVIMKDWKWESEADILIAGARNPFQIKIEVTHSWGKPILHILIANDRINILSFTEKKLYSGRMTPEALSRFFPGRRLDRSLIWAILRGYPPLMDYERIGTPERNTIRLIDRKGRLVESIELDPEKWPVRAYFPDEDLSLEFSGFITRGGIQYASEIKGNSLHGGKDLILQHGSMVFNRKIPEQIFHLENMPGFETVHLERSHGGKKE